MIVLLVPFHKFVTTWLMIDKASPSSYSPAKTICNLLQRITSSLLYALEDETN